MRGLIGAAALAALPAFAATTTINTLLDTDNNSASGCTVPTLNGPVQGVESIVTTTVIADATGYRTQSISMQNCIAGSFGAPAFITNVPSPIARGNGTGGSTAVESYVPHPYLPATGQPMRVAITVAGSDGLTGGDALTQTAAGGPILVAGAPLVVIPTLTKLSLALTALLLAGALWYARRRGWTGMQLVVVAVFALSLSGQIIAAIVRDGLVADWTGVAPAAIDPAGDAPSGSDITNFYSVSEAGAVFFRYDIALNAPPVANAQSVVAVANVALPITLSGTDYEASPLTYTVLTQPTHGTLTGTPPNLTYTANSTYGGPDSFTFRVNDGVLDSATATVTIDVKLPPTITSVNTATFIPGQANSFNFTATAIPSATFALSACNVALPPSITVTNNANNTATLAGNPTVAQGGTYICTLTASNGFGTNATQTFTLNLGLPPTVTSAATTTFTVGAAGSFAVTTTATPATTGITQAGALPAGVTFVYNGPGTPLTGTLAGTPAAGTGGVYPFTLTAANGIPPNTVQNFTLTVNQAPVITSAAATACTVGLACTFTVTTSGFPAPAIVAGGVALPSGMTFVDNANGTGTLSGTPNTGTVGGSPYAITFTATNVAGSTVPQAFALTINKANTTTAISNAAALASTPTVVGEPYAVNVTVTPAGTGTPTGTVTVGDGAATCTITLPATSCSLVSTTVGAPKTITAIYNGDASFNTSSAPGGTTHTVNKAATTTTISNAAALAAATVVGQAYPVTWTVTVNAPGAVGAALTGNVTVSDGSASCTAAIAAGTCSLTSTTAGAKSLTATYAGDANYLTSASAPATPHTVNPAATTTTISNAAALGTATVVGQAYPVTWTVTVNAPGALGAALTGNVTVSDGSATCTAAVAAGTCNVTSTTAGAKSLTATYAGDANYLTSASAPATPHTVGLPNTTTTITNAATLSSTPSLVSAAYAVNWSVTVNAPGTLGAPLTGNVTVSDGSANCVAPVAAGTCNLTSTTSGAKLLTATYSGDGNYNGSVSSPATPHDVNQAPTIAVNVNNPFTIGVAGSLITFTVTGFPAPTLALSGCALPPGLSLTGAQISGTATAGAVTVSGCVVTATNVAGSAPTTPAFTITVNQAPSITSVGPAVFTVGTNSSYSINATGTPGMSSITLTGCVLPAGLAFSYVSGNSATISGNATAGGSVTCLVTAINGIAPNATQSLTVTANQAPTISAISNSTFTVGTPGSGSFTVTGVPVPTLALSGCTLPANLTLTGTQISGTAALGATSVSGCIVTASNGIGSPAATAPFAITVIAPPPTVTASGNPAATFTEDGPAVVIDSGMTAASIGTTTLVGATASITGNFQAGQDVLAFATIGPISGSYVAGTGVLTLTGTDTVANYQAALRTITYSNSSQTPNITARTVSFVVSHSTASSAAATRTVNVVAVNDAPVVTASVGATAFTEPAGAGAIGAGSAVLVDSGLTVADVDSANLTGATIIIGAGLITSEDSLLFTNTASITGSYAAASGTLTLTGTDTLANYQAALRSVRYLNSSHDPNPSPRTVSFQVNDGGAVNNLSNVATKTVSITATNTPPTATGFVGLPAQAGIPITYPAGKLFGTDAEAGTTVTVATTPDSNCAGCLLTINADGSFTFTPPPSAAGTTVSFTYHVTDNGSPGAGLSSVPATVSFSVAGPAIYFVKSAAVGVGNCTLGNECTLTTAVTNIGASTSAHIFISDANTHTHAAIAHNGDNRVIGQGVVVASFDALFAIAAPAQGTLAARPAVNGTKPRVNTTITAHNNTHVRGLNLTPAAGANKGVTATGRTGLLFTDLTIDMTASGATGNAIDLTTSSADFTGGGLVITGTSGRGFHATGAGTITVQGTGNKVTTTTGRAIHVDTTTIGASGMTFEAVSANGTDSGIFLNATGASAGLTVTGTAAANSGGTIQNTSSHGISLATTTSPSFNRMNIQSTGGSGVNGTAVTHFSFTNGTINNSGNAVLHSNIAFNANEAANNNLSGVVTVTGNTLTNAFDSGLDIRGALGTISNATVTGNTITSSTNGATSKGQGINFVGLGTAGGTHSVTKATISNNIITNFPSGAGIQVSGGNASSAGSPQATFGIPGDPTNIISITGNQIKGASIAIPMNTSAIIYAISGVARGNADISSNGTVANPLTNMVGTAILVGFNGNATGTVTTTNNVIVANNSLGSQGIGGGGGITFGATDTPNMTWTIANNNISATDGNGILAVVRGVNGTGRFKIQNNTVAAPLGGVRPGIRVDAGNATGNATVCLNISGNTSAGNVGFPQGIGLRRQTTNTNAFGVNGMAATATPGVEAYVDGLNPAGNGTLLISGTTGFSNCSFP